MKMVEQCNDDRFEVIKETKKYILEATNIDTSKDEMKVLDDICFRLWQLGLTKRNKDKLYELTKTPTLEQVKKKWEALGYKWCISNSNKHIVLTKEVKNDMYDGDYTKIISINSITKTYGCYIDESYSHDKLTFQEHQLLIKTFKALGW